MLSSVLNLSDYPLFPVCVCVCWVGGLVASSCLTPCDPMDCSGSSVHGSFQAGILEWAAIFLPRDLPNPGIEALQASLPSEPPRKPSPSMWRPGAF